MHWKLAIGISFVAFLTGYNIGKPWNCEEARSMWNDAEQEKRDVAKRFLNGGFRDLSHAETAAMDADDKSLDRFQKVKEKCNLR